MTLASWYLRVCTMYVCPVQSLLDDGKFCGLPLDEDNEDDKTEGRIKAWVEQLKGEGF